MVKASDILSDSENTVDLQGVTARKGSVAATMVNAWAFHQLAQQPADHAQWEQVEAFNQDQRELIPTLWGLRLLEFFPVEEWINATPGNEGRTWVAMLYFEKYPQELTKQREDLLRAALSRGSELLNRVWKSLKM